MTKHVDQIEELIKLVSRYSALKSPCGCNPAFESSYKDSILIRIIELEPCAKAAWLEGEISWLKKQISIMEKL